MRKKIVGILISGMLLYNPGQSEAQNNNKQPLPSSKVEKEALLSALCFIEIADLQRLDDLKPATEITDSVFTTDLLQQAESKKAYLISEIRNYNSATEQARIQNLICMAHSIPVLDAIHINREPIRDEDYNDLCQQISWKKQIIERANLESAYASLNLFGTPLYLPINKTINENLPCGYVTRQKAIEKQLSDFGEKMYLKTDLVREIQQFLGEILFAATPEQIKEIKIPEGIMDKKVRTELSITISEAASRLKILDLAEVEKIRDEIVYHLSELSDTNEMEHLMNFRVKNKYLKEVIDETVQMRKDQVRMNNPKEWIGTQIDKIFNALLFIREEQGGFEDSIITIDPEIRNTGIRGQLIAEAEMISEIYRRLRQGNAEFEIYRELAYADNTRAVSNLKVDSMIMDAGSRMEISKAMEQVTHLFDDFKQYQKIGAELTRVDQLIREATTPRGLQHLQVDATIMDDSIKQILAERIEHKIRLLQHQQYIEKQTVMSVSVLDFFILLRKTYTHRALDEIKIPVIIDDPECTQWMMNSLEAKRRYFESQMDRDKKITALRCHLNRTYLK